MNCIFKQFVRSCALSHAKPFINTHYKCGSFIFTNTYATESDNFPSSFDQRRAPVSRRREGPDFEEDVDVGEKIVSRPSLPIITSRKIDFPNPYVEPKQAWLENMNTIRTEKLGIIDLHPDVFSAPPRLDILYENIKWQQLYREINYERALTKGDMDKGRRKPFRQKSTGRHRAGNTKNPNFKNGCTSHGPRGPHSKYYMLSNDKREMGLRIALSVKYAQNDLHIVDSLEIPVDDPEYLQEMMDTRYWGFSVLFVDDTDVMPMNLSLACSELGQFNLLPVYGLNIFSILKHETVVLTLAAVEKLEKKLLEQLHRADYKQHTK
ncbi:RM04-like protein [Mya arenaria]|uniref:Large ribosomal subunit protein uL4m n=1 Tax=Mya arenaria TaxID=6604 RepID=A0ABY7EPV0_MYAAR|nr:39S ribosomal protein L4, mitochondrial-like [Mya arenaria]WAR10977.1 RM04-like protein [Mya arenaria]